MALQLSAKGTLSELEQLWRWEKLCELVHVDYYKRSLVPNDEVFTVTQEDLIANGMLVPS